MKAKQLIYQRDIRRPQIYQGVRQSSILPPSLLFNKYAEEKFKLALDGIRIGVFIELKDNQYHQICQLYRCPG